MDSTVRVDLSLSFSSSSNLLINFGVILSTDTKVKRMHKSKLTERSLLLINISCTSCTKCVELLGFESVYPAKGVRILANSFATRLYFWLSLSLHFWPCRCYTSLRICCTSITLVTLLLLTITLLFPCYTPMHSLYSSFTRYTHHVSVSLLHFRPFLPYYTLHLCPTSTLCSPPVTSHFWQWTACSSNGKAVLT